MRASTHKPSLHLLIAENQQAFTTPRGAYVVLTFAWDWCVISSLVFIGEQVGGWWAYSLIVVIISRKMYGLFELTHHAVHGNLFKNKSLNERLECLYALPIFQKVSTYRPHHLNHHSEFNLLSHQYESSKEEYRSYLKQYGFNKAWSSSKLYLMWFIFLRPFFGLIQFINLRDLVINFKDKAYSKSILLFWLPLTVFFFYLGLGSLLIWYWFIPRFIIYPIIYFWSDVIFHFNCPPNGLRDTSGLSALLFNIRGSGFHTLHHTHPKIPYFNLAKANIVVRQFRKPVLFRGTLSEIRQLVSFKID
jgi:fatty acid desaturase